MERDTVFPASLQSILADSHSAGCSSARVQLQCGWKGASPPPGSQRSLLCLQLLPRQLVEASNSRERSFLVSRFLLLVLYLHHLWHRQAQCFKLPSLPVGWLQVGSEELTPSHQHHPTGAAAAAPVSQTTAAPPTGAAFYSSTGLILNQRHLLSILVEFPGKTGLRIAHAVSLSSRTTGQFQLNLTEGWGRSYVSVSGITKISRQRSEVPLTCSARRRLPTSTVIERQRAPPGGGEGSPGLMRFTARVTANFYVTVSKCTTLQGSSLEFDGPA